MSAWTQFAGEVQRSLPRDATFTERGQAMKVAGRLWREGKHSASDAISAIPGASTSHNPSVGNDVVIGALSGVAAGFVAPMLPVHILANPEQESAAAGAIVGLLLGGLESALVGGIAGYFTGKWRAGQATPAAGM